MKGKAARETFDFEAFLKNVPKLHSWDGEKTFCSGGFGAPEELRLLRKLAEQAPVIVETGIGNSTIAFLSAQPSLVISVAPDVPVWTRLKDYCRSVDLSLDGLRAIVDYSEYALPDLAREFRDADKFVDLFLIDGSHHWPTVFVDLCYANVLLKKGGVLLLDDINIFQLNMIAKHLNSSPDYRLVGEVSKKTLIFEKTSSERLMARPSRFTSKMQERHNAADPYALSF